MSDRYLTQRNDTMTTKATLLAMLADLSDDAVVTFCTRDNNLKLRGLSSNASGTAVLFDLTVDHEADKADDEEEREYNEWAADEMGI